MIEVVQAFDPAPIAKLEHVRFAPITLRLAEQEPLDQNLSDGYHASTNAAENPESLPHTPQPHLAPIPPPC